MPGIRHSRESGNPERRAPAKTAMDPRFREGDGKALYSFLLDVPQKDDRRDDDPVEIFAVGGRHNKLACRHIGHIVRIRLDLDVGGELLLHREVWCLEPSVDQLLSLRICRPAEPSLLAAAADR